MSAETHEIDVTGIEPHLVLMALVNAQQPVGTGFLDPNARSKMSPEQAKALLDRWIKNDGTCYFDYVWGRPIKATIGKLTLDAYLFDRDAFSGLAALAIEQLRKELQK